MVPIEGGCLHPADRADPLRAEANRQINRCRNQRVDPDRADMLSQQFDAWLQARSKWFDDEGAMEWMIRNCFCGIEENRPIQRVVPAFPELADRIIGDSEPPVFPKLANSGGRFQGRLNWWGGLQLDRELLGKLVSTFFDQKELR